jgi:hypothetical protein
MVLCVLKPFRMKFLIAFMMAWLVLPGISIAQAAKPFDLLVHEFMADPSPQAGLPNHEFIELKNVSGSPVNLRNWKISDASSTATITINYTLEADSLVILCPVAAVAAFSAYGPAIGLAGFPSLNNDGDLIMLTSPEGRMIHSIEYTTNWYRNEVKSEGGWTLEMIDTQNPCGGSDNWNSSMHPSGGSPGRSNSVTGTVRDEKPPVLLRSYTVDPNTVVAVFDEPLDSLSAAQIPHYNSNKGINITEARPLLPSMKEVKLKLMPPLLKDTVYELSVENITDCAGKAALLTTVPMGLPSGPESRDVIINELLFNPLPGGTDYIEVYNRSSRIIDVSQLLIASRAAAGNLLSPRKLSEHSFLLFPAQFLVVTDNISIVRKQYAARDSLQMLSISPMPSMPDDKGTLVLLNSRGQVMDEVSYEHGWHFPLIARPEGVALERIHPGQPSQDKHNWTSAASDAGYGTPTYRNSQLGSLPALNGSMGITPKVFSPDNDGFDDWCMVTYELPAPGYVANIIVFDVRGYAVRNLCRNMVLSEKGFLRWDGLNDAGGQLASGIYIIVAELFNTGGKTAKFKNTVTLARTF